MDKAGRKVQFPAAALVGKRFSSLLVIATTNSEQCIVVRCDCGTKKVVSKYPVLNRRVTACGCERTHSTHGKSGSSTYTAWCNLRRRCYDPTYEHFVNYAGRGIVVCNGWRTSFKSFYTDMGDKPRNMSINRIDNDGGYWCGHCDQCVANSWKKNCEWATAKTQMNNTSNNRNLVLNGQSRTIAEWAEISSINQWTLRGRIRRGWSPARALTTPSHVQGMEAQLG